MTTVKRFEDLEIWQEARILCKMIHTISESTTLSKDFALKNQILASSGSIMDNIAEGFERNGNKEFINFLFIAKGSLGEVRSQVHRSFDANHIDEKTNDELLAYCFNLSGRIAHFISYLSNSGYRGTKKK
jgi:four helix bundle protein